MQSIWYSLYVKAKVKQHKVSQIFGVQVIINCCEPKVGKGSIFVQYINNLHKMAVIDLDLSICKDFDYEYYS